MRDRRLHRAQQHLRRGDDAGVRRRRLSVEEDQLPAGADGAGDRAGRQGGGGVPAVAAGVAGRSRGVLLHQAGQHDHGAWPCRFVLAADPATSGRG